MTSKRFTSREPRAAGCGHGLCAVAVPALLAARRFVAVAVLGLLLATTVLGAVSTRVPMAKEPPEPSYTIPNIAAFGMSLTALAIACKRYHRV
ncbi:MAG: hypothetical protein IMZ44_10260 [Planctomycetes bacterium]|nr:hypothetical protein [Planctomycetota bacterium]